MRRIRTRHVFAVGVVVAALRRSPCRRRASAAGSGLPTKIGKGEGQLNVIAWEGTTDQ